MSYNRLGNNRLLNNYRGPYVYRAVIVQQDTVLQPFLKYKKSSIQKKKSSRLYNIQFLITTAIVHSMRVRTSPREKFKCTFFRALLKSPISARIGTGTASRAFHIPNGPSFFYLSDSFDLRSEEVPLYYIYISDRDRYYTCIMMQPGSRG